MFVLPKVDLYTYNILVAFTIHVSPRMKDYCFDICVHIWAFFFFFLEKQTHTHTRERKRGSKIKAHHNSTQKPW